MSDDTTNQTARNFRFQGTPELFVSATLAQWQIVKPDFQVYERRQSRVEEWIEIYRFAPGRIPSPRDPSHTSLGFNRFPPMIDGKRATGKSCDFDAYALDASRSVVFASYTNNPDFTEEIFDWLTDVLAAYIDAAPATAQSAQSDAGNTAIETQSDDQAGAPRPGRRELHAHERARERLRTGEDEATIKADWRKDYEDETGMAPAQTASGEKELWRNVKRAVKIDR